MDRRQGRAAAGSARLAGLARVRAGGLKLRRLGRLRPTVPELAVVLTRVKSRRVMGEVIDDAVAGLGLEVVARVPDRTAVEQADVTRTPIAIAEPGSAVALAYSKLVEHLEARAVMA